MRVRADAPLDEVESSEDESVHSALILATGTARKIGSTLCHGKNLLLVHTTILESRKGKNFVFLRARAAVGTYICMYVCMYVCMYICMYVCMYVCVYVCMYVCMYVCKRRKYIVFFSHSRKVPFAPFQIIVSPSYLLFTRVF